MLFAARTFLSASFGTDLLLLNFHCSLSMPTPLMPPRSLRGRPASTQSARSDGRSPRSTQGFSLTDGAPNDRSPFPRLCWRHRRSRA
jgi:hypothetical protein